MDTPEKVPVRLCQKCLRMPAVRQVEVAGRRKLWQCQPCLDRARPHGYGMTWKNT